MIRLALVLVASLPSASRTATELPFYCETRTIVGTGAKGDVPIEKALAARMWLAQLDVAPNRETSYVDIQQHGARPFRELLVSWNIDAPTGTGFVVELRVAAQDEEPSEWMHVGAWGEEIAGPRTVTCKGGKVDVDFFVGERTFESAMVRVRATAKGPGQIVRIRHVTLCFSDREHAVPALALPKKRAWGQALDVPFRSQKVEKPEIASRICSPTSLAMVLDFRGVTRPTAEVCERAYDAASGIYGNWPHNVQAAYSLGVPGYLTRFCDWTAVEREIAAGNPLIVSIAAKKGQLTGAPYQQTSGHLLVLRGFDERGDCIVNDPAALDAERGRITYKRAELEEVWMGRGGVTYVLLRP